jgi:putative membrane protein
MNRELAGTIAGFAATAPMTVAMMALHRALPEQDQEPLPPRQIVENVAATAGVDLGADEESRETVTLAAHFAYGASVGALYGPFAGATGLAPVAEGMLYGLAVWGGSYLGALPGAGLYRSAKEEAPARNALMIAAHLIWGASLGVMVGALTRDSESR